MATNTPVFNIFSKTTPIKTLGRLPEAKMSRCRTIIKLFEEFLSLKYLGEPAFKRFRLLCSTPTS